jgi:hypothetical protein
MANLRPPPHYSGTPTLTSLPAETVLFRVHRSGHPAHEFNPRPSHRYYGGGRFDSTADDCYSYLYAGESIDTAIAESFMRDLPFDDFGVLQIPRGLIKCRRISAVQTRLDLTLLSLRSAADLSAVSQDPWLVSCGPPSYPQSRHWGHWIRSQAPTAAGYVWMSHREPTMQAYVLFGDRIPGDAIETITDYGLLPEGEAEFDSPRGRRALIRRLTAYNVALSRR